MLRPTFHKLNFFTALGQCYAWYTCYAISKGRYFLKDELEQGFMQDNIIASHTCFGGHMDVNC